MASANASCTSPIRSASEKIESGFAASPAMAARRVGVYNTRSGHKYQFCLTISEMKRHTNTVGICINFERLSGVKLELGFARLEYCSVVDRCLSVC